MLNLPLRSQHLRESRHLSKLVKSPTASPPTCNPRHELLRNHGGVVEGTELVSSISPYPLNLKYYAQVQTAPSFHFSWLEEGREGVWSQEPKSLSIYSNPVSSKTGSFIQAHLCVAFPDQLEFGVRASPSIHSKPSAWKAHVSKTSQALS